MAIRKTPMKKAPVAAAPAITTTPVRNSAIPPKPAAKKLADPEQIAVRAYEIWASGTGGSEHDNWVRAEGELRAVKPMPRGVCFSRHLHVWSGTKWLRSRPPRVAQA